MSDQFYQQFPSEQPYQQQNNPYQQGPNQPYPNPYDNQVPPEIKKWNWGAFAFSLFWGIGNKVWLSLLLLVPCVNIIMMFVLGAKGNEWAWKAGNYRDVETFKTVQATWNRAGFVYFWIMIVSLVIYFGLIALLIYAGSFEEGYRYYNY